MTAIATAIDPREQIARAWKAAESVVDPEIPVLSPAWTTDWMTDAGKAKLKEYGIAPPAGKASRRALFGEDEVSCPHCGSSNTERISEFGSTACKALWRCKACAEPFDYFKCI